MRILACLTPLFGLAACTGALPPGTRDTVSVADDGCVHPLWEGGWPFPSNRLVTRDAASPTGVRLAIDESVIPLSRNDAAPLEAAWFEGIDGFSRLAPAVVQLDTAVDPADFPALSDATAPVSLLDVDAGTFVSGRLSVTDDGRAISVWPDAALTPGALHAIVLRSDLPTATCFSAGPALLTAEAAGDEHADEMAAARAGAVAAGLSEQEVAAVVPFTTRSATAEAATMESISSSAGDRADVAGLSLTTVADCASTEDTYCGDGIAWAVRGTAALPKWQATDGMFVVDADGVPTAQGTEDVGFWLLVPAVDGPAPLLVLQHGLGGDKEGFLGFGQRLAAEGYAVVAIDAVAHGERPHENDTTMDFFGIDFTQWKVPVARDNIRQTAADHLAIRALFAAVTGEDGSFAGQSFAIDAEDASYVGQSLGGIIGATTCASDTGIDRCALNVPGGRLVEIVRANAAYATLMNIYFDPSEQEADIELFSSLAQILADAADPATAGPRILASAPARPVLVQEATEDGTVANQTTEVMVRSMGIPLLRPSIEDIRGLDGADMPVEDNVTGADTSVTAGLTQFDAEHPFLTSGEAEGERAYAQILDFLGQGRISEDGGP